MARHLALIGFMGVGKSTLGRKAARLVGRTFVDVDALVEREAGATVAELFEREGESRFRELEEAVAVSALAADEPTVLALGGGAVESDRTR